jgi:hypothetical protein
MTVAEQVQMLVSWILGLYERGALMVAEQKWMFLGR